MGKTIEYIGEQVEISDYLPRHHFDSQDGWATADIPINPKMRDDFDRTPNEERDPLEVEHWWLKPYIVTDTYQRIDRNYPAFTDRMKSYGDMEIESEEKWQAREEASKKAWFEAWPSGVRFEVRCLSGGAWDRSSSIAMVATLSEAIEIAESGSIPDFRSLVGEILENK